MIRRTILTFIGIVLSVAGGYLLSRVGRCFLNIRYDCIYVTIRAGGMGLFLFSLGVYLLAEEFLGQSFVERIFAKFSRKIKIVKAPVSGQLPLWIHNAWVGIELPVFKKCKVGYYVLSVKALNALEKAQPDAAKWLRTEKSQLMQPHVKLLFRKEYCISLPLIQWRKSS